MKQCATAIGYACQTLNFFQIVNLCFPGSLQSETPRLSEEFFALPLEEKMKLDRSESSDRNGMPQERGY